jgi:hypothetical protein
MGKKKEKVHPLQTPEMDTLTEEQEAQIAVFVAEVWEPMQAAGELAPLWAAMTAADRRVACYKFHIARKWEREKAEEMFRGANANRIERKLDELPCFPPCFPIRGWDLKEVAGFLGHADARARGELDHIYGHMAAKYQATYHKWDKNGHPLFIENTGKIQVKSLVARYKELAKIGDNYTVKCVNYHFHFNEVGGHLARFQDKMRRGQRPEGREQVLGVVALLNCAGLGYSHLYNPALEMLKANWAADAEHYPEGLHALYVCNCPTMIMFAYGIVKGWLDPRVQDKIVFLKPKDTAARLLEIIDADCLPVELGGTCSCFNGCVQTPDDDGGPDAADDDSLTEKVVVGAGKKFVKVVDGAEAEVLSWEFLVQDEHNVEFSATFVAEGDDEADGRELFSAAKVQFNADQWTFESKGAVTFTFSNAYSWVRGKSVDLRVFKSSAAA